MTNNSTKTGILMASAANQSPQPLEIGGFVPLLMYGGVAVAVILAMSYFSQIQLQAIANLFKTVNKKQK
ncbi:hypothetical protein VB713_00435 [Anabaena cylindrica UHCC 0172]|uniref:hypothetical protein n=1 Tax=Anabaena cylindrica TaxID=1165 RepID=UPI002B21CBA2|nr:hypothetical protein [Anabaena cylindrica]MEA5549459.1 hypothetical protein [Anabaena cylindrica UHCC 0172]